MINMTGTIVKRPVVTKLWIHVCVSEDRDEWNEEFKINCEKCSDDKSETPEAQAERIREQRCRGDSVVAFQGRQVQKTVNKVLRVRGKMLNGKSNGPADCFVVEMFSRYPTEVVYEVTHWFQKRFMGLSRVPEAWRFYVECFERNRMRNCKRSSLVSCDRVIECVLKVVFFDTGGHAARGKGTDRMA